MKRPLRLGLGLLGLAFWGPATAEVLQIRALEGGRVVAESASGARLWTARVVTERGVPTLRTTREGYLVVNDRWVVDRRGRLVSRPSIINEVHGRDGLEGGNPSRSNLTWEPPFTVSDGFVFGKPLFDSLGNAWLILEEDGSPDSVVSRTSIGHSNVWEEPLLIAELLEGNTGDGDSAIDSNDVVTAAFRRNAPGIQLDAARYTPGQGWSEVETIYPPGDFVQAVIATADNMGNTIVGTDGNDGTALYTMIYDGKAGAWMAPERISPLGFDELVGPTLVRNRDGSAVYAVFWGFGGPTRGIYARRFDSESVSWGPLIRLPASRNSVVPDFASAGAAIPAAVDPSGNLWISHYRMRDLKSGETLWTLLMSQVTPGGGAMLPVVLTRHLDSPPGLLSFGDFAASDTGDLLYAYTRFSQAQQSGEITAFRFDVEQQGWNGPEPLLIVPGTSPDLVRVAYQVGDAAIAVFVDSTDLANRSTVSRTFDGTAWLPDLISVNGDIGEIFRLASDGGDVVMNINLRETEGSQATWLFAK